MQKPLSIRQMSRMANTLRQDVIKMLEKAGSGHSAGSLDMAEVFTVLFFSGIIKHKPKRPNWPERDRIILSNGHIVPIRYAAMARAGYFPMSWLNSLRKLGSKLQGHPSIHDLPSLETSSGPLGQGLSQAVGMALAAQMDDKKLEIYCITSDGEFDEGNTWEALMLAAKHKLPNLTVIMDRNNIQIDGHTEDVMPLEPLTEKLKAFNWHVIDIDGHNIEEIVDALNKSRSIFEKPVIILAHTIAGKGVDFMEFKYEWHGKPPKPKEAEKALKQLRTLGGKISSEMD